MCARNPFFRAEANDVITSCFPCRTGSAGIFLPLIDSCRFSRKWVSRDDEQSGEDSNVKTSLINQLQALLEEKSFIKYIK